MTELPEYTETIPHLQDHPLFSGSQSVGMISGDAPKYLDKIPLRLREHVRRFGHPMLGMDLKAMGLRHEATEGKYGAPERSYIVYGATKDQLNNLANKYGQESFVHVPNGHKSAKMHFSDLAEENGQSLRGHYRPTTGSYAFHATNKPDNFYTHLPGKGYLRLNFDFKKPPQTDSEITKAEVMQGLIGALKKALK